MTASEYILHAINTKIDEGYKLSNSEVQQVIDATSKIVKDESAFTIFKNIFEKASSTEYLFLKNLTKRELEVLELIGQQQNSMAISETLQIKLSTVETHRKNIRRKLKIKGKGKLYEFAIISNLIKIVKFDDDKTE